MITNLSTGALEPEFSESQILSVACDIYLRDPELRSALERHAMKLLTLGGLGEEMDAIWPRARSRAIALLEQEKKFETDTPFVLADEDSESA